MPYNPHVVYPTPRPSLHAKLDEWVDAGLIGSEHAASIEHYESEISEESPNRFSLLAEAVGYVGAGLAFAAVAMAIGEHWDGLSTLSRIAVLAIPTLVAGAASWWIGRSDEPAAMRLAGVLWLLAMVGLAGVAAVVWTDALHGGDRAEHGTALFVGSITFSTAAVGWWRRRLEPQQLAMFGAAITASLGIVEVASAARTTSMSPLLSGITLLALATAWLFAGLIGRLSPTLLANVLGSVLILVSVQITRAGNVHAGLWLGLGAAIGLMSAGVARREIEVLLIGTVGLFQWTPQIALFYLKDTLGAEATLFLIGTLLVVVAGIMTRIYPWVRARHHEVDSQM